MTENKSLARAEKWKLNSFKIFRSDAKLNWDRTLIGFCLQF